MTRGNGADEQLGSGLPGLSDNAPRLPETIVIESFVCHWRHPSGHGDDLPTVLVVTPIAYDGDQQVVAAGGKQYQIVFMPDGFKQLQADVARGGYASPVEAVRTLKGLGL